MTSQKQTLVENAYPGDLPAKVAQMRPKAGWRQIATHVNSKLPYGLTVTYETLRVWYGHVSDPDGRMQ